MSENNDYTVNWKINVEATSPIEAAIKTWRDDFGRGYGQPGPDEACVFEVDGETIDLSDDQYSGYFEA